MLFLGLTMMGYFSYKHLSMELYPNAELPQLNVVISVKSEMDPIYIRNHAVIPVEGVISSMEGVEEISSKITSKRTNISISFNQNIDMKYTYLKLESKIKTLSNTLPEEFSVSVNKVNAGNVSDQFMVLQILGDEDIDYIRNITDIDIQTPLENIDGIAAVTIMGGQQKSVNIDLNEEQCEALKLTTNSISSLISSNMSEKSFAGTVNQDKRKFFVNVSAEYLALDQLGSIVVAPGPVLLKDISKISFGTKSPESYARVNGKEVITCILTKSPSVNIIDLSKKVKQEISELNKELASKGISIKIGTDTSEVMEDNIDTIIDLGITGAILAIFILFIFLNNVRIVTFIAFAIPISIFSSFYFFYMGDITINILTLTGIALAVGMLLDNSVVVMENIFRHRAKGESPLEASFNGIKEVWKAITASTITTITVFVPFLFSSDYLLKLIGKHVGISIIATLLLSLVVALLLIPMAVNYFMSKKDTQVNFNNISIHDRAIQIYSAILKMSLRRPTSIVVCSIVLLILTVTLALTTSTNTLKEVDVDTFNVYLTFNPSNTLDKTDAIVRSYEKELGKIAEVEEFSSKVFTTDANLTIKLKEDYADINHKNIDQLKDEVIRIGYQFPISDVSLEALESSENFSGGSGGGGGGMLSGSSALLGRMGVGSQSENIIIHGQDFTQMMNLAELFKNQLEELDNISGAYISSSSSKREAKIFFNQYLMGIQDVTIQNVIGELNNFSKENISSIKYKTDNLDYDIIIKNDDDTLSSYADKEDMTLEDLQILQVPNSDNNLIKLDEFSDINLGFGKGNINRVNQEEEITVRYRFNSDVNESKDLLTAARLEIDNLVQGTDIPSGLAVEIEHETNETSEYVFLILATLALIYMILASVFESLTAPIVLMFTIPMAAIGSAIALLITSNSPMNANVFIGFIILVGIVVNNSIILIDYTGQLRKSGFRKQRAILYAGISRLRPILITAITTIIAMLPLAMGKGQFVSGLGAPFAITVIGGLFISTILTLVIIPTLYSGLEDALYRLRTQSIAIKIIQLVAFVLCILFIFITEDSLLWQLAYLSAAIILIPAVTWFFENSLRRANSNIISSKEEISIEIRNLVKIYGRPSEFTREMKSGIRVRKRLGLLSNYKVIADLKVLIWLVPLTLFFIYFTYFYQTLCFWALILSIFVWTLSKNILNILSIYTKNNEYKSLFSTIKIVKNSIYYLLPLFSLIWANYKFYEHGSVPLIGLLWYIWITAHYLTIKINSDNIDINNLVGKFKRIRKFVYSKALKVPFVGKASTPFKALDGISMTIHTGMFGLLGPNGAGKTTMMRIICGIFEQNYGKIFINGIDTQEKREELQGLIGYLPQEFGTYENLTSWEFLEYQAILKGIFNTKTRNNRIKEVLDAVHMYENKDKKIGGFSGGMKQRIGIAQTLLNLPKILIVDEPTAGLDPRERIRFRNLLVELSKNRIIIFSTHIIEDIASSCNQVGVINKGCLKYNGTPMEMLQIAKDVTWTFEISAEEFAKISDELIIVHHIKNGENIRVRCLSQNKPTENAVKTSPLLEDSYLWLLHGIKIENNEELITGQGLN